MASLRDQNINNMTTSDLGKFPLTLPADLDAFFDRIREKEKKLLGMEREIQELQVNPQEGAGSP